MCRGRSILKEVTLCRDAMITEVCQWVQILSPCLVCVGINVCIAGTDVSVGLVSMPKKIDGLSIIHSLFGHLTLK